MGRADTSKARLKFAKVQLKPEVFITQPIPREWCEPLEGRCRVNIHRASRPLSRATWRRTLREVEGLWCFLSDSIDREVLKGAPRLRVIANCAAGVNNVDLVEATARGIVVANTPDVLTDATADLTWALILAVTRRIVEGDDMVRAGRFKEWRADLLLGTDLSGKTLGVVGFGRIGRAVAKRAEGFGMRVVYVSRHEEKIPNARRVSLASLLAQSDMVTLHVPLTAQTRHLIGRRELAMMKRTAYLINTARGPVVDEVALVRALKGGRLLGAGLDVFEREPALTPGLATLPNVVLMPHVGSATTGTRARMASLTRDNLLTALAGKRPRYVVNPEVF